MLSGAVEMWHSSVAGRRLESDDDWSTKPSRAAAEIPPESMAYSHLDIPGSSKGEDQSHVLKLAQI
jgi:hypothetical protein